VSPAATRTFGHYISIHRHDFAESAASRPVTLPPGVDRVPHNPSADTADQ
jgi:hypothetical protein